MATASETTTGTLSAAQKTFYFNEFLARYRRVCVAQRFGQEATLDLHNGPSVNWFRYYPAALQTSAATVEGDTAALTYNMFSGMNVTGTVETWNNQWRFSMLHYKTSRDANLKQGTDVLAQNAAESIDWNTLLTLAEGCIWPLHAGAVSSAGVIDGTFYKEGILTLSASSTTVLYVSNSATYGGTPPTGTLTSGGFVGGWVCVSKGAAYGGCARVESQVSTFGTMTALTLSHALPDTPVSAGSTNSKGVTTLTLSSPFAGGTELSASHTFTTPVAQKAEEILFKNKAMPFDDGFYAAIVAPEVYRQMLSDSTWKLAAQSWDAGSGLKDNNIGTWSRTKFFRSTTPANYITGSGVYHSFSLVPSGDNTAGNGNVFVTFILGRDAFGTVKIQGEDFPEMKIAIPSVDDNNPAVPVNLYGTMSWKVFWKVVPLNANFCVGVFSYV